MSGAFRLNRMELQAELFARLRGVREPRKAVINVARRLGPLLGVDEVAVFLRTPDGNAHQAWSRVPGAKWDTELFAAYLQGQRPPIPSNLMVATIERRGRRWAALVVRDESVQFTSDHRRALFSVAQMVSETIAELDERRLRDIRRRFVEKLAHHSNPKDLIYEILDGIRAITRYDHSSSMFLARDGQNELELVAEQIAWTKAKSLRIGTSITVSPQLREVLADETVLLLEQDENGWPEKDHPHLVEFIGDLHRRMAGVDAPPEVAVLLAPVWTPAGNLAVLRVAARRLGVLGAYERDLLPEFLPLASLAVQFSMRTESLEEQVLQSERKHVLANLTRGIAHDVNNALGGVLPLVQQLQSEAKEGTVDSTSLLGDLKHIETNIQTSRRIFGGMLNVARGSARSVGQGNVRRAIDTALSVLHDGLRRRNIDATLDLPDSLPAIATGQDNLTQLFLNLLANAQDAMEHGGTLHVSACMEPTGVRVEVRDSGEGITEEQRRRIFEPFFTPKSEGTGLGLTICASIVREMKGRIELQSEEGAGTTVIVGLPCVPDEAQGSA